MTKLIHGAVLAAAVALSVPGFALADWRHGNHYYNHHHRHHVCMFRHHHRVCFWR